MGILKIQDEEINEEIENYHALLIGVDKFKDDNIYNLNGVCKDIENFGKILNKEGFSNFQVNSLTNPTLIEARKEISKISSKGSENDVIFFYFSGHGFKNDKNNDSFYLIFNDTEKDLLEATGLESEFVLSQFRHSKCKNFIIIIDTCYSGAFFNNNRGIPRGLVALTSCGENEVAFETHEGGMFTNIILKGLESDYIDANRDGIITFSELFDYVTNEFLNSENSPKKKYGKTVTPQKWEWNVTKNLCLFNSPKLLFISYQRKQKALVTKISNTLKKNDIKTFIDQEKIRIGDDWQERLETEIENARAFLFIMDNEILDSKVANWELETALKYNIPILPIVLDETMKIHAMFEVRYGHCNRIIFDIVNFDQSMQTLIYHIKAFRIKKDETKNAKNERNTR